LNGQTPFKLVDDQEVVIPLHFCANMDRIASILEFDHVLNTRKHLYQLNQLEEERMLTQQHQKIQKIRKKSWHDRHLKNKEISDGCLVLLYDSQVICKPNKLETAWLGLYVVEEI